MRPLVVMFVVAAVWQGLSAQSGSRREALDHLFPDRPPPTRPSSRRMSNTAPPKPVGVVLVGRPDCPGRVVCSTDLARVVDRTSGAIRSLHLATVDMLERTNAGMKL